MLNNVRLCWIPVKDLKIWIWCILFWRNWMVRTPQRWSAESYSVSVDARGELRAGLRPTDSHWHPNHCESAILFCHVAVVEGPLSVTKHQIDNRLWQQSCMAWSPAAALWFEQSEDNRKAFCEGTLNLPIAQALDIAESPRCRYLRLAEQSCVCLEAMGGHRWSPRSTPGAGVQACEICTFCLGKPWKTDGIHQSPFGDIISWYIMIWYKYKHIM